MYNKFVRNKKRRHAPIVFAFRWAFVLSAALGFAVLLTILIMPSGSAVDSFDDSTVIMDGVTIDGLDVSGLTRTDARELVLKATNEKLAGMCISIGDGKSCYLLTAADFEFTTNLEDAITMALALNRDTSVVNALSDSVMINDTVINTTLTVDEAQLEYCALRASEFLSLPAVEPYAQPQTAGNSPGFVYHEGEQGMTLDTAKLMEDIASNVAIMNLNVAITPVFLPQEPSLTMEEVKANTAQRSVFKTYYAEGSLKATSRIHNVKKGANLLNGCVIAPGEEFSFNDYIGPRTYDGGWEPAPGIVNGSMYEMQAGGGICQVSTTLHNAVMLAGPELDVTLRKNHSWPSSYVDYGLDATVSTGGPDFKFVNNTGAPIYIFAYADNANYIMTVYIYGAPLPEGLSYRVYATTDEVTEPEETLIVEEPTWPDGYTRTVIKSRRGYKTTAYRETIKDGEVTDTQTLYRYTYRAVRGETHVGTGDPNLPVPPA